MSKMYRVHGGSHTVSLTPSVVPASGTVPRCPHSNMLFGKEIETGVSLNCYMCTPVRPDETPVRKTGAA